MKLEWSLKNIFSKKALAFRPAPAINLVGNSVLWHNDNLETYTDAYLKNAGLYSIIKRIGKTASIAPFKVFRVKDQKKFLKYKHWTGENATPESIMRAFTIKAQVFEEDNEHPLNKLIDRPNDLQRGNEFVENSIGFKLLTGNRFIMLGLLQEGANERKPFNLYNLPPQYMRIIGDKTLFGVAGYELNLGERTKIEKESIIHSRYWTSQFDKSGSHLMGLSPLTPANKNLTRSDAGLERSVAMLQNAGAAGLLYTKGERETMSAEQAGALKVKVNTEVLGGANAGKVALANGDMGYINFGLTAVEMSILDMEKYSLQQLCNIYQVPYTLFSSDSSTYNNIKEAKKELITMAVVPELASLRDDWNEIAKLYKESDLYVDYDLSVYPELQEDLEKTANIMLKAYWFTGNEKRLAMSYDEDNSNEMMNKYLVPSGLVQIDDLGMAEIDTDLIN